MNTAELRQLGIPELRKKLFELQKELVSLQFAHKVKQQKNTSELQVVRRQVARVMTIIREKELWEAFGSPEFAPPPPAQVSTDAPVSMTEETGEPATT